MICICSTYPCRDIISYVTKTHNAKGSEREAKPIIRYGCPVRFRTMADLQLNRRIKYDHIILRDNTPSSRELIAHNSSDLMQHIMRFTLYDRDPNEFEILNVEHPNSLDSIELHILVQRYHYPTSSRAYHFYNKHQNHKSQLNEWTNSVSTIFDLQIPMDPKVRKLGENTSKIQNPKLRKYVTEIDDHICDWLRGGIISSFDDVQIALSSLDLAPINKNNQTLIQTPYGKHYLKHEKYRNEEAHSQFISNMADSSRPSNDISTKAKRTAAASLDRIYRERAKEFDKRTKGITYAKTPDLSVRKRPIEHHINKEPSISHGPDHDIHLPINIGDVDMAVSICNKRLNTGDNVYYEKAKRLYTSVSNAIRRIRSITQSITPIAKKSRDISLCIANRTIQRSKSLQHRDPYLEHRTWDASDVIANEQLGIQNPANPRQRPNMLSNNTEPMPAQTPILTTAPVEQEMDIEI